MKPNRKYGLYLVLVLIVLGNQRVAARMICSQNRASCLEFPMEWDRLEAEKALIASRYVDDDRLTLQVIESSPDYWEQSIQDYLRPLKKKGGLREYDVEEITAGGNKYTVYSYEAFGRRYKSGVSRRIDFWVYRKGPVVRIVQFEAAGGTFFKMGYEIEEILGSASFFDPKSIEKKKKNPPEEDDGWGEYGYKPKGEKNTGSGDHYGWGDDREEAEGRESQENQVDESVAVNEETSGLTGGVPNDTFDSFKSRVLPESEMKKRWLSLEEGFFYSETKKRRLFLEEGSMGQERKRDWLHDDSFSSDGSEETDKGDFFPFPHALDDDHSDAGNGFGTE